MLGSDYASPSDVAAWGRVCRQGCLIVARDTIHRVARASVRCRLPPLLYFREDA